MLSAVALSLGKALATQSERPARSISGTLQLSRGARHGQKEGRFRKAAHRQPPECEKVHRPSNARVHARRPFIALLPDRDALLRVVRYGNMLDRQIRRALAALRRIRRVPRRDTREKPY